MGTSLIDPTEYDDWLKHTLELLTFEVGGARLILCWECIKVRGFTKEFNRRLDALTYPNREGKS